MHSAYQDQERCLVPFPIFYFFYFSVGPHSPLSPGDEGGEDGAVDQRALAANVTLLVYELAPGKLLGIRDKACQRLQALLSFLHLDIDLTLIICN